LFSQVNWKHSFLRNSRDYLASWLDAVVQNKVIPLVTIRSSVVGCADHAAAIALFNKGRIPQIFVSIQQGPGETLEGSISRLRAIFPGRNVIFSGRSSRQDRRLICVSYSNATDEPLAA
jgi:hypothetical protein